MAGLPKFSLNYALGIRHLFASSFFVASIIFAYSFGRFIFILVD